jgi:hypothetical protein
LYTVLQLTIFKAGFRICIDLLRIRIQFRIRIKFWIKGFDNQNFKKVTAEKREHPALQEIKFLYFFPCCGFGMFIPDPIFSISDLGLKRSQIRIHIEEFKYFEAKRLKFSKIRSGTFIPDPRSGFFSSLIQDPIKVRNSLLISDSIWLKKCSLESYPV